MSEPLPYLVSPGTIKTGFEKIPVAATPEKVHRDFVSTVLNMKGGAGQAFLSFLKKLGLVATDGTPTDLYNRFRNSTTAGSAIAEAIKKAYKPLGDQNEYFYLLQEQPLKALIVQVTGVSSDSQVAKLVFLTLKTLKAYANFDSSKDNNENPPKPIQAAIVPFNGRAESKESELSTSGIGMNLSYTINLNLPATSDQSVFNAIFRSLKEHLLSNAD